MSGFDPRITPARPDLAAEHLRGKVSASNYVRGELRQVTAPFVSLTSKPQLSASADTELLLGERFTVYEEKDGWAWGQAEHDGYVGYVSLAGAFALGEIGPEPTHRVTHSLSRGYGAASAKASVGWLFSLGSRLHVARESGRFSEVHLSGHAAYVPAAHLKPIGEYADDFVAVAEMFLGAPYVWGGRTSLGLDCSALVQLSLAEAGIKSPRDSDQQRAALGTSLGAAEALSQMQRGDLIFWKNHVAISLDGARIIHANALAMAMSIDDAIPFARAVEATEGPVLAVKRLQSKSHSP